MKYDDFLNSFAQYDSFKENEFNQKENDLAFIIKSKYMKILKEFIKTMYSGLKFDIIFRTRNPKERMVEWYGMSYMELKIYDVTTLPSYSPQVFSDVYKTPHCQEYISGDLIYENIESYIPEINKHLLISFSPINEPDNFMMQHLNISDFECWRKYFHVEYAKNEIMSSGSESFYSRRISDFNLF